MEYPDLTHQFICNIIRASLLIIRLEYTQEYQKDRHEYIVDAHEIYDSMMDATREDRIFYHI